jgi:glycerol-3-phosphate acyltransferase PlsX
MRIAVDAHGGDLAPRAAVEGAVEAVRTDPGLEVVLVGRGEGWDPWLRSAPSGRVHIHRTEDVIGPAEPPVQAVRQKPHASLVEAIRLVKAGDADGAVSAGNTGAMMAAGLMVLGRLGGVDRPALCAVLPTRDGRGVLMLDVGANVDAKPLHLLQYAYMGALYAERVLQVAAPRVGLVNIGTEAGKGPAALQEAYGRLEVAPLNFVGNVEARDVLAGGADVLVMDGFVGNVVLKVVEGTVAEVMHGVRAALTDGLRAKAGGLLARPALMRLRRRLDYQEVGGVPLLGLGGVVIKAHGASRTRAFANAIHRGAEQASADVNGLIGSALREVGGARAEGSPT